MCTACDKLVINPYVTKMISLWLKMHTCSVNTGNSTAGDDVQIHLSACCRDGVMLLNPPSPHMYAVIASRKLLTQHEFSYLHREIPVNKSTVCSLPMGSVAMQAVDTREKQ